MKLLGQLFSVLLLILLSAACGGTLGDADTGNAAGPEGPALIMFYTDN